MAKLKTAKSINFGTIYKRGGKGNYYFENKALGVPAKSLGTADPDEATQVAIERYGHLQLRDQDKQAEALLQKYRSAHDKISEAAKPRIAIDSIWSTYLDTLSRYGGGRSLHEDATPDSPLSPSQLKSAKGVLAGFARWLQDNHPEAKTMDAVTVPMVDSFFDALRKRSAASNYNLTRANLRVIWKRLAVRGGIEKNPFDAIPPIAKAIVEREQQQSKRRPFTLAQLKVIFARAMDWMKPAVHVAYETGLRLGDIVSLRVSELDLDEGFIFKRTRKGGKPQSFYVPDSTQYLRDWLGELEEPSDYVFPRLAAAYLAIGRKRDTGLAGKEFMRFLKVVCKIKVVNDSGKTVLGFHSFRVSHATHTRSLGATVGEVQRHLGHSYRQTTDGYIQEDTATIKARLVAEHRPLPLAIVGRLQAAKTLVRKLSEGELAELKKWIAGL